MTHLLWNSKNKKKEEVTYGVREIWRKNKVIFNIRSRFCVSCYQCSIINFQIIFAKLKFRKVPNFQADFMLCYVTSQIKVDWSGVYIVKENSEDWEQYFHAFYRLFISSQMKGNSCLPLSCLVKCCRQWDPHRPCQVYIRFFAGTKTDFPRKPFGKSKGLPWGKRICWE